jgi:hypothetical protein
MNEFAVALSIAVRGDTRRYARTDLEQGVRVGDRLPDDFVVDMSNPAHRAAYEVCCRPSWHTLTPEVHRCYAGARSEARHCDQKTRKLCYPRSKRNARRLGELPAMDA